jgi:hypothetical protein
MLERTQGLFVYHLPLMYIITKGNLLLVYTGVAPLRTKGVAPLRTKGVAPLRTKGVAPLRTKGVAPLRTKRPEQRGLGYNTLVIQLPH